MDTTIRIHYEDDTHFLKCVDFIKSLGPAYYICQETGRTGHARPHIQAYTSMDKYKTLAVLRDRLKKVLKNEAGILSYSVSALRMTKVRYLAYMMKEGPDAFVASCSLDQDQTEAALLKIAFDESSKKDTRPSTQYQKMLDDFGSEIIAEPREVARKMLLWFHSKGKIIPDRNTLQKYVNTYMFGQDPETMADKIIADIYCWN